MRFGWHPGEDLALNSEAQLKSSTMLFMLLIFTQIFSAYQAGSGKKSIFKQNPLSNSYLLLSIIICLLITKIITTYNPLQNFLGLAELTIAEWQIIAFAILILIIIEEIRKFISLQSDASQKNLTTTTPTK